MSKFYETYRYKDIIPWPENLPWNLEKCAKRLDIYKTKPKLEFYFVSQLELMETITKEAELCGEITEEDLYTIFAKIGLWVPDKYLHVFDKKQNGKVPEKKRLSLQCSHSDTPR